jgi:hypothetical protein
MQEVQQSNTLNLNVNETLSQLSPNIKTSFVLTVDIWRFNIEALHTLHSSFLHQVKSSQLVVLHFEQNIPGPFNLMGVGLPSVVHQKNETTHIEICNERRPKNENMVMLE